MSKRTFLRRTAFGLAAGAGVFAGANTTLAQINLNGGTFDAHSAVVDGGLNARYWSFTTNNLYGNLDRPVNQFLPYENFDTSTRFLNGADGLGAPAPLTPFVQALPVLQVPIDFPVGNGADGPDGNLFDGQAVFTAPTDGILASWSGIFTAPEAGVYRFETVSDDATMIFIDGQTVINNNAQQGMTRVGADVTLTAGNHEILITYQEGDGGNGVFAEWRAPSAGALSLIDPSASPTVFRNREVVDRSADAVTVTADSAIDVLASKAMFGDLTLTNSTLSITGTRIADATTFGAATATGASGINATGDAWLASLNEGGGGLTTFTKSGPGGLRINGSSTLTNATTVAINQGSLAINATGGNQSIGSANIRLGGGTLGITNTDATAATIGNAVEVTANSTINQGAGGGATITAVTVQPGVTLSKTGAGGANLTLGTVTVPGGGAITFNVRNGRLDTAAYNSGGSALTVNKSGTGAMRLPTIGTPLAAGGAFNVSAGQLQVTNDAVGTSIGTTAVNLTGGTLAIQSVGQLTGFVEGLNEGAVAGAFNQNTPNPGGAVTMGTDRAQIVNNDAVFPNNTTYIYSGQINWPNNNGDGTGTIAFGENFDDSVLLRIGGVTTPPINNNAWNVPTWSQPITLPAGWTDFEVRFGQGVGGVGPNNNGGWTEALGFGIDTDKSSFGLEMAQYVAPMEPQNGTPDLFRAPQFTGASYANTPISVGAGNSTINVSGTATDVALGTIAMSNNGNLVINGPTKTNVAGVSVAAGTTSQLTGGLTTPNIVQVQNVQAAGATLNVAGVVDIRGTITGGKLGAVGGGLANVRPTATFAGTPTIETAVASVINFDAGAGTLNAGSVSGNQLNDGTVRFSTGTTNLGGAMLTATPGGTVEGLLAGYLPGSFNENGANPGTSPPPNNTGGVRLDFIHGQNGTTPNVWVGDNETWVYTGQIFDADGVFSFAEHIDDNTLIRINGQQILRNTQWDVPTFGVANNIPDPDGDQWYDIDVRFGEGGGGQGPSGGGDPEPGWSGTYGFGYSPDMEADANGANYIPPVEPAGGGPTLFRTFREFGSVQVNAGATGALAGFRDHANVTVDGRLNLTPNGTNAGTSSVNTLVINGTGVLDIADNDMVIKSTSGGKDTEHAAIQAEIVSAQNGPDESFITKWDGPGLTSTSARAANVNAGFDLTGLGVIRNSDLDVTTGVPGSAFTTFNGIPVTPDDILVKYTYTGDGNLDGAVTFDDYAAMDSAFFGLIPNLGWATGDINFDGSITFDDYSVVDQAFFFQGAPLAGEGGGVAAVPEPGTWLLAAFAGLAGLFTWFRRRR
jgi:hypothetical protein